MSSTVAGTQQQLDGARTSARPDRSLVIGGGPERRPQVHRCARRPEPELQPVGRDREHVGREEPRVVRGVDVVDLAGRALPSALRRRGLHLYHDQRQPVHPVHQVEPARRLTRNGDRHLIRHHQRVRGRGLQVDDLQRVPHPGPVPELLLPAQDLQHLPVGPHQPALNGVDQRGDLRDHRVHVEPANHRGVEPDDCVAQLADEHRLGGGPWQVPPGRVGPAQRQRPLDHQVLNLAFADPRRHGLRPPARRT